MEEKPESHRERCPHLSLDMTSNIQTKFEFIGSDPGKQHNNLKNKQSFLKEFSQSCLRNTVGGCFS